MSIYSSDPVGAEQQTAKIAYMNASSTTIRQILNALAAAEREEDNDEKEIIYDREIARFNQLDRKGIIEAIHEAIGNSPKRKKVSASLFAQLYDQPGIENVFLELLGSSDDYVRNEIIQTIGLRKLVGLVGALNMHFYRECDDFCADMILHALGRLADESSLPIFLEVIKRNDSKYQWRLLCAAVNFARTEFTDYVTSVFNDHSTDKQYRIMAAWSLVKMGSVKHFDHLVEMLDDPEIRTANSYDPGHSFRAAQAISDIKGWDFEGTRSSVALVKAKLNS